MDNSEDYILYMKNIFVKKKNQKNFEKFKKIECSKKLKNRREAAKNFWGRVGGGEGGGEPGLKLLILIIYNFRLVLGLEVAEHTPHNRN